MPDLFEHCCKCEGITSRPGTFEDSFYAGDYGPLCEECYEALVAAAPETARQRDMLLKACRFFVGVIETEHAYGLSEAEDGIRAAIAAMESGRRMLGKSGRARK